MGSLTPSERVRAIPSHLAKVQHLPCVQCSAQNTSEHEMLERFNRHDDSVADIAN